MKNSRSIIIVESPNDRFFVEALLRTMQPENSENVQLEAISFDDLQDFVGDGGKQFRGLSETSIAQKIKQILLDIEKYPNLENIGILIDQDNDTAEQRLTLISNAVQQILPDTPNITAENLFFPCLYQNIPLQTACYFNGINGKGELENVFTFIFVKICYPCVLHF